MKTGKRSRGSTPNDSSWSGADHAARQDVKDAKVNADRIARRRKLTHETREKRDHIRLKLHITKVNRELAKLKERLERWDDVEEKRKITESKLKEEEAQKPKSTKVRKGPETWQLRGAARPASEVYDFDVRYEDPHIEALDKAKERASRQVNLLAKYRGFFSQSTHVPPQGREYLSLLMQRGHLSRENRQFKTAREAWLECIDLEGDEPITTARDDLMRMYMDLRKRPAALRLGERFAEDQSTWIRFSTALAALQEEAPGASLHLESAIRSNVLCAYYLAYYETFHDIMEYTEEIEESDDPQSSLEEAIEYCSCSAKDWTKGNHHLCVRDAIQRALESLHENLRPIDVDWKERLEQLHKDWMSRTGTAKIKDDDPLGPEKGEVDLGMFIGMYRTAMEIVEEPK